VRNAFVAELCRAARDDPSLWLLAGDLGYSVLEPFIEEFPERYLNVGVAEQNMIGVAAGMALSGQRVVVYSIVNFATLRCFEQIRNDVVYHGLPVTIVGVGGGFAYGGQGYTHHGLEDLAVMKSLNAIDVAAPADAHETQLVVNAALRHDGPTYIRLGKAGEPAVYQHPPVQVRGDMIALRDGEDALIIATGGLVAEALMAADMLSSEGLAVGVRSMPWLAPFDDASIRHAAGQFPLIVTAEEATASGGLGSAVAAEVAALPGVRAQLEIAAVPGDDKHKVMAQATARLEYRLDAAGLAARIRQRLAG